MPEGMNWDPQSPIIDSILAMKKQKGSQPAKPTNKTVLSSRMHTESSSLAKQYRTNAQGEDLHSQYLKTEIHESASMMIEFRQLKKEMEYINKHLEAELGSLLERKGSDKIWKMHRQLLSTRLFRIKETSEEQLLEEYGKLIQATELLYSKLSNSERVKDSIFIKDQQDLILFFKHLFGKPYTLCNLPHFRKIMSTIWQMHHLPNTKPDHMLEHLRVWAHGIQLPMNPASVHLQRKVFASPKNLKKEATFQNNESCYYHIEGADCLGLNPLLLAVHADKSEAFEPAIKSGASIFSCPLTICKGVYSSSTSTKKLKSKTTVSVQESFPVPSRHQYNSIEVLMLYRQYQHIVNILTCEEMTKIKQLRKHKNSLYQRIKMIPNCCFQIHWKAFSKGILNFKSLPKDVIVVFKKEGLIRIDYHVDDLEQPQPEGNFSLLLKTYPEEERKMEFYFIDHRAKKIYDLMKEVDSKKAKLRYEQIVGFGNIEDQSLISLRGTMKVVGEGKKQQIKETMELTAQFSYQNVSKAELFPLKTVQDYEKCLYTSQMINYKLLEHSEIEALLSQKVGSLPKVKSKQIKSSLSMKLEWVEQNIRLVDFIDILEILDRKSVLFVKLVKTLKAVVKGESFEKFKLGQKLPQKIVMDLGADFGLEIEMKNLLYCELNEAVFSLEYRTKTEMYEQENEGLESLQETMVVNESYSIDISRFLGKTDKLVMREEEQANRKFQQLLTCEMEGNSDEDEQVDRRCIIPQPLLN